MRCLLLVDIQNDFLPGGALAVPDGDAVLPVVTRLVNRFELVVATQDWHPPNHCSFVENHPGHHVGDIVEVNGIEQMLWPRHCVQGTVGAAFASALDALRMEHVVKKGTDPTVDSYSGFFDNHRRHATHLANYLYDHDVQEVYVAGLATDYCVKFTVADALDLGFNTYLVEDACRGVQQHPGDVAAAIDEMRSAGAQCIQSSTLLGS